MVIMSNNYTIINTADVTDEMIDNSNITSKDTMRKSIDGTKSLLKFSGSTPECFDGYTIYTEAETLEEIKKEEWVFPDVIS